MIRFILSAMIFHVSTLMTVGGYEVLHQLQKAGAQPVAPLMVHSSGFLYGTTSGGGARDAGTIFRVDLAGSLSVIHSFDSANGSAPTGALAEGDGGEIFGATSSGGVGGFGTVFKITPAGGFTKLMDFTGAVNGSVPGSLVRGSDGNFYERRLGVGVVQLERSSE